VRIALLNRAQRALLGGVGGESVRAALVDAQRERSRADERARRHAVLAQLGQQALATTDLDTLLSEAARTVAQALGVEQVAIFELLPGGTQLSPRTATVPGAATAPSSVSLAGRAIDSEGAVGDAGAQAGGAGAALAVAIRAPGQGSSPYGVLEVRASAPRSFDGDDEAFLVSVGHMLATAIVGLERQGRLARSLQSMQAITGQLAEGVLAVDRKGRITFVNAAASRVLGRPAAELLGRSIQHVAVVPTPVDLAAVAREAAEAFRDQAAAAALSLETEAPEVLPPAHCDRGRVLQVLSNLLANAIQVTGAGGRVSLRVEAGGSEATVSVTDTGPGVSPEELPRLFERYWRGHRTRHAGSGLGLAIAKAIVDAHAGRIWAESRVGEGATFRFTLPLSARSASS